jgi:hypothetical protein
LLELLKQPSRENREGFLLVARTSRASFSSSKSKDEDEKENEEEDRNEASLIPEQLFESVPRFGFSRNVGRVLGLVHVFAPHHFKIFAVVRDVLFRDRFRAAIPALVSHRAIVTDAIQTHLQVCSTNTGFRPAGRPRQPVFAPTFPAMSRSCHAGIVNFAANFGER